LLKERSGAEICFPDKELLQEQQALENYRTENPRVTDARHLVSFIKETPLAKRGYVVCRCARPQVLSNNCIAVPWWMM
jgi:hypothetical protein